MNGCVHGAFAAFVFISLIIGIITFLLGCNPHIKNQCIAYNTVEGTVYDYSFLTKTCKKCTRYNRGNCLSYSYYPCYNAYVNFHYGSNDTCLFQTAREKSTEAAAQHSVLRYDIGEEKTLLKLKNDDECSEPSQGMVTWRAGVAVLSICAFSMIVWVAFAVFECILNVNSGMPVSASFHNQAKVAPMAVMSPVAVAVAEPIGGGYDMY